jgi:hypothetical protein
MRNVEADASATGATRPPTPPQSSANARRHAFVSAVISRNRTGQLLDAGLGHLRHGQGATFVRDLGADACRAALVALTTSAARHAASEANLGAGDVCLARGVTSAPE